MPPRRPKHSRDEPSEPEVPFSDDAEEPEKQVRKPRKKKVQPEPAPNFLRPYPGIVSVHVNSKVPSVLRWQERMRERGFDIAADQFFGPKSRKACQELQQSLGMKADGILDHKTWKATWETPVP